MLEYPYPEFDSCFGLEPAQLQSQSQSQTQTYDARLASEIRSSSNSYLREMNRLYLVPSLE
jgi:hypothetical protein